MAALLPLGAGIFCAAGFWLASGGDEAPVALGELRLLRLRRRAASWLVAASGLPWVCALGRLGPMRELAEALARSALGQAWGLAGPTATAALLLAWIVAGVAGLVCAGPIGIVACVVLMGVGLWAWARSGERRRADELARQVPGMFRSLAVALGAGRTLSQAISYVGSRGDGELSREFGRAALRVSCGVSANEALDELARRTKAPGIDLMVCALVVSSRTGAPLEGLFMRSARLAERRFELERELKGKTAQVRLSARIVSALPVGLVTLLALISPDFREGLATPVGTGSVCVAVVLDATALLVIRRLMKGVL